MIIGGSPCQSFSQAGKGEGFEGKSGLIEYYFQILEHIQTLNPEVLFLLENVKMKKAWENVISERLETKPILINAALVSAQQRSRNFWTNIPNITQPEDKGIMLCDIIEEGVVDRDKSFCIDANYWKGTNVEQYIKKSRRQIAFTERRTEEAKRIRKEYRELYGKDFSPRRAKELVAREDGKMNCLTATFSIKEHTLIDEKLYYRKLTPIECERLQTFPDSYTDCISNTKRYKALGNSWCVDVIVHIFKNIKEVK
jgi:site-specific DNA-cytosine methylase